ncbi:MAG: hypothetical protein JWP64_5901 [Pseudonocardia sp.]|jgi:hypothetical protein|nr:hypothetical protein [Pseudonocardia sp.]MDT7703974.1 hypothetical protein [Pseudonocardiales bacterium]
MAWMTSTPANLVVTASPPGRISSTSSAMSRRVSCRRSVSGETAAFNRGAIRPHTGRIADTTTPTTFAEFVGSLGIPA